MERIGGGLCRRRTDAELAAKALSDEDTGSFYRAYVHGFTSKDDACSWVAMFELAAIDVRALPLSAPPALAQ